jgi:hypothetical protein
VEKFKKFLKDNKEQVLNYFNEQYQMSLCDVVDNCAPEDVLDEIDNGDETYEDWYDQNSHNCAHQVEYNAAFKVLIKYEEEIDVSYKDEDAQGYLIEFLGMTISPTGKNIFYTEE